MTTPANAARGDRWYLRPRVAFPVIGAMVLLAALLAPDQVAGRTGNARLSTYSTEPQGAQLFYQLAQRFGWRVEQRRTPELAPDPGVIQALLAPVVPLRMGEVHALLEHVRHGGALFVVLSGGDLIGDSLRIARGFLGGRARQRDAEDTVCAPKTRSFVPLWPDRALLYDLRWKGPPPDGVVTFVRVDSGSADRGNVRRTRSPPAAVGFPYGRGRIVVGSDPDLLRNDVLRGCEYGLDVSAVRMLEYLREGGSVVRNRVVFDEFHQGFGSQPGTMRAIAAYLGGTPSGHLLFQLLGAGLLLLISAAPRVIPPRDPDRIERRSALEHVDALARAYAQVGATRTATLRLLRGVRRRVEHGVARARGSESDEVFLTRAQEAAPALAPDVARIRHALASPVPPRELATVGAALHRLETTLTRT
ncbi:MAG TPA: DUF4350 domain-containing protein [Gemmatimonadaceae bacterium]|nr:DUF4350 domain-containing protein [Gemmatimonadaceae bacterium]